MIRYLLAVPLLAVPSGSAASVRIVDNAFSPRTVTVAPGTRITWTNTGKSPHTVTSSAFDSGNLDPGKTFGWTATAGTHTYVCKYHTGMSATVVVSASGLPKTGGDHVALGLLVLGVTVVAGVGVRYGWRMR